MNNVGRPLALLYLWGVSNRKFELARLRIPGKHVGAQNATYNVAKVGHIVHVRQGTGNQDIILAFDW